MLTTVNWPLLIVSCGGWIHPSDLTRRTSVWRSTATSFHFQGEERGGERRREVERGGEEDMQSWANQVTESCQLIMFQWQHSILEVRWGLGLVPDWVSSQWGEANRSHVTYLVRTGLDELEAQRIDRNRRASKCSGPDVWVNVLVLVRAAPAASLCFMSFSSNGRVDTFFFFLKIESMVKKGKLI